MGAEFGEASIRTSADALWRDQESFNMSSTLLPVCWCPSLSTS